MKREQLLRRLDGIERPPPSIYNNPARKSFEVVFEWGRGEVDGKGEGVDEGVGGLMSLEDSSRECALVIQQNPGLRVPQLAELMGRSRATVERHLKALRERGLVVFRGAPKTGGYFLVGRGSGDGKS